MIGSDSSLRATKLRTSTEGLSSHWASSATSSRGLSVDASARRSRTASAMRKCSGGSSSPMPKAAPSTAWCLAVSPVACDRTGRRSCCKPANASRASDWTPLVASTFISRASASAIASDSSRDFPMPGSPRRTSAAPVRPTSSRSPVRTSISAERPSSGARSFDSANIEAPSSHGPKGESTAAGYMRVPRALRERGAHLQPLWPVRLAGARHGRRRLDGGADQIGHRSWLRERDRV